MKRFVNPLALCALAACVVSLVGWQVHAETNRVQFPNLDELVHYTTVKRGNVTEHIMTTPEAMEAVKGGRPIPAGTHFVLVDQKRAQALMRIMMRTAAPPIGNSNGSGRTSRST